MTAQEINRHVEAGEMEAVPREADCAMCKGHGFYGSPGYRCQFCKGTGKVKFWRPRDAAATPLPTHPQQEKL